MNTIQITDAGVALMSSATEPIVLTSYKLGSASGYIPTGAQTNIQGSVVGTGSVGAPVVQNANTILYPIELLGSAGPYQFGEVGYYYNSTLFAILVLDEPMSKLPYDQTSNTGGPVVIDAFLPMLGSNYQMWANIAQANTSKVSVVNGPEQLPFSVQAVPNFFIVQAAAGAKPFLAYTDRIGLWNFDSFGLADDAPIVSSTSTAITVATSQIQHLDFTGLGSLIIQLTSGRGYASVRYVTSMLPSGPNTVISLSAPLAKLPQAGDTLNFYQPTIVGTAAATPGVFTTLTATGQVQLGPTTASAIDATPIGLTIPAAAGFTALTATGATSLQALTATSLDGAVIGATTPKAATFTNLTVTGTISGTVFNNLFSSPPPIGSGTANTGRFSSLIVTGATTLAGLSSTAINASPIGQTTPSAGSFTVLSASGLTTLAGLVNTGGNTTLGPLTATAIDASPIGGTTASSGRFTTLSASSSISAPGGVTLSGAAAPLILGSSAGTTGQVLASAGPGATPTWVAAPTTGGAASFSSLTVTGATTLQAVTATSLNSTPIGATTASTGAFTTLAASGLTTLSSGLTLSGGALTVGSSAGTVGQVLTSQGVGSLPIWTTPLKNGDSPSFASLTISGTTSLQATTITALTVSAATSLQALTATSLTLTGSNPITLNSNVGASGQYLTSQGAGAAPIWSSPSFSNVNVTGGTIDGTTIGASTPAAGSFTVLSLVGPNPLSLNGQIGTLGQVLTSQGTGVAPIWTTPASGGGSSGGAANFTSGTIDGVLIGSTTPADAIVVNFQATGNTILAGTTLTSLVITGNSALSIHGSTGSAGQFLASAGSGAAPVWTNSATITGGSIDGTPIGSTAPSTGVFTNLTLSETTSELDLNGDPGSAGMVLTSQGPGAVPQWTVPPGAGTGSPSGALNSFQFNDTGTFNGLSTFKVMSGVVTSTADISVSGLTIGIGPNGALSNVVMGAGAMGANVGGQSVVALGQNVLAANVIGSEIVGIGAGALQANTYGANLVAVGTGALALNTTGNNLVAIGSLSLGANVTNNGSVGVGHQTLKLATGDGNLALGTNSGSAITTGQKNVIVGSYDGTAAPITKTGSNYIVLSDGDGNVRFFYDGTNNRFDFLSASGSMVARIDNTGNLTSNGLTLVGTASPISLNGSVGTAGQVLMSGGAGLTPTWGAAAVPGGTTGLIQYNNGGAFGGVSTLSLTGGVVTSSADIVVNGVTVGQGAFAGTNTALGNQVLKVATSSSGDNVGTGYRVFLALTSGQKNVGSGSGALTALMDGNRNIGIGYQAGAALLHGVSNIMVGAGALKTLAGTVTSANNIAIGDNALAAQTGDGPNLAIGPGAGATVTTGSNLVLIGGYTGTGGPVSLTGSNFLVLSDTAGLVLGYHDGTNHVWKFPNASGTVVNQLDETLGLVSSLGLQLTGATAPLSVGGSVGTTGQVLTSAGTAATPTWTTPAQTTPPGVNNQTGTSYVLVLTDAPATSARSGIVTMSNAAGNVVHVPDDTTTNFPIGTYIELIQLGAGQTSILGDGSAVVRTPSTLNVRAQYSTVTLRKVAANLWVLGGDVA